MSEPNLIVKGTVVKVSETEQVTDSFKKRTLLLKTKGDYPQEIEFEFVQNRVDLLDSVVEGADATVFFNLKGRTWEKAGQEPRVFTSLQGWKIEATPF